MSWGVALRNSVAIGLGGIATLLSGGSQTGTIYLLAENDDFLVQEDGSKILV